MTDQNDALATALEALEAKATPGPWEHSEHEFNAPPYEGTLEHEHGIYPPLGECGPVAIAGGNDNAALIVALRNALPEILSALRSQMSAVPPQHAETTTQPWTVGERRAAVELVNERTASRARGEAAARLRQEDR